LPSLAAVKVSAALVLLPVSAFRVVVGTIAVPVQAGEDTVTAKTIRTAARPLFTRPPKAGSAGRRAILWSWGVTGYYAKYSSTCGVFALQVTSRR
jgi:hypothetical protein